MHILLSLQLIGLGWFPASGFSAGLLGLHPEQHIPSWTPFSSVDIEHTLSFTRFAGRPWIHRPMQRFQVVVYTDRPHIWTQKKYKGVMRLSRWYFRRCRMDFSIPKLHVVPPNTLTRKGFVQWKIPRHVKPIQNTTFLFLTDRVDYMWGRPKSKRRKKIKLLGVSARVWLRRKSSHWKAYPAVWMRMSPVFSTLAHEIGHRWGLKHSKRPYRLMLNGAGVRSSLHTLGTSLLGFLAPQRLRFSVKECKTMYAMLHREKKRAAAKKKRVSIRIYPRKASKKIRIRP